MDDDHQGMLSRPKRKRNECAAVLTHRARCTHRARVPIEIATVATLSRNDNFAGGKGTRRPRMGPNAGTRETGRQAGLRYLIVKVQYFLILCKNNEEQLV